MRYIQFALAATCLLGAVAAHATDPATSPFAADRYDYNVLPSAKAAPQPPAPAKCHGGKPACHPSR
ncbi:hypothetical protein [Cupriavidus pauculus]|uniref:hypothetical protein n=1 Tax=Cupriavidus pauculus TaxID=82633 RepID=UPI001EE1EA34|nr:hypothetical protein [Cupriavidus pauculus]GJG97921.1 hypothetical protein CBA19C6_25550 [Cupriavidus pauculus]